MAIKASDQITIIDITDGFTVTLTTDSYTFPGTTTAAIPGNVSTQINAMQGSKTVSASVISSEIEKPSGVTVTSNDDDTAPTLTISVDGTVTEGGIVKIPVHIGDVTITKTFTFAIAFKGVNGTPGTSVTITDTEVTYAVTNDTAEPSSWQEDIPTANPGQYLWTKTVVTYSDGNSTTTYSYAKQGATGVAGESVTVDSTSVTYGVSESSSTEPASWSDEPPEVPEGQYLWTKTVVTYSDGNSTTTYSYAKQGETGAKGDKGEDAIILKVISTEGTIFKNSEIVTDLIAHVYKGGIEVTGEALTSLGTIKWYEGENTTPVATGSTFKINAGDVTNRGAFSAQLEG